MKTYEQLQKEVDAYCKRHGIVPKKTSSNPFDKVYKVEGFTCDWLEARITPKGRTVFKHDGKVTSIHK